MGVITYENEITSSIPPAKMLKAFVLDVDKLIPKILPQTIKCSQFNYVKHRVDGIDEENLTYSYSVIEGDALMGTLESISYEVKFAASPDGEIDIKEDQIKAGKEKASGMFKAIEAYLLVNPDAY
ncbi:hypothetical protein AAG906_027654 [Vitis piasezkii]